MSTDLNDSEEARLTEDACGKLWEIYLEEAHRYDEGLVRSWKEDMDVILVFSGLYSAVLTAFVVESYKRLQPDQTEVTSSLLLHISQQLASGGIEPAATIPKFTADASAVACNILWFLSLTLALSCAFLATFVQQWTRHFLHRTTILRTPTARARLFSYLYFGLKNFQMHTIVDVIPSILHLSLFSFFAGLIAFLHTVNSAVRWLISGALIVIACIYATFTFMPLFKLSSPYQTPLSPMIWRLWQSFWWSLEKFTNLRRNIFCCFGSADILPLASDRQYNLTYAMVAASYVEHEERETKSMSWTLRSLTDDYELLPFVEALPDVIFGIEGKLHTSNFYLIRPLLETTDPSMDIISRIFALMVNAQNYWVTDAHRNRCTMAIPRALWALAYLLNTCPNEFSLRKTGRQSWFSKDQVRKLEGEKWNLMLDWYFPAIALIKSNICLCSDTDGASAVSSDFEKPPDFNQSQEAQEEQARILIDYLREASKDPFVFMFAPTFFALHGHRFTEKLDKTPIYDNLLSLLRECKTNEADRIATKIDPVFRAMLMISDKTQALHISEYLNERVRRTWAPTQWLWLIPDIAEPRNRSKFPNDPGHKRLIRAVLDHGLKSTECIGALRGHLWCFDQLDGARIHPDDYDFLDQSWWSEVDPIWFEVLSHIEDLRPDEITAAHESLAVMVKAMVLKKINAGHSSTGTAPDVDPIKFVDAQIGDSSLISEPPDSLAMKSAFTKLVVRQLEVLDLTQWITSSHPRDTLDFLQYSKLKGSGYTVSPELAQELANQTRRRCEEWKNSPSYLRDTLEVVWVLWEPEESMVSDGDELKAEELRTKIGITQETAQAIAQAAQAILDQDDDNRSGYLSYNVAGLLTDRVRNAQRFWEDHFPYLLPLPPIVESELDENTESSAVEEQEGHQELGSPAFGKATDDQDWPTIVPAPESRPPSRTRSVESFRSWRIVQ